SNQPLHGESNDARATALRGSRQANDIAVGLSFSGGGLRAAAFSLGVLQGLESVRDRNGPTLLDDTILITSVSGGSMTAAYFGLHGKEALTSFRERGLLHDGDSELRTNLWNPANFVRLLAGGLNDRDNFHRWLDEGLFEKATFGDLYRRAGPEIWIN